MNLAPRALESRIRYHAIPVMHGIEPRRFGDGDRLMMLYTHVLRRGRLGGRSPADRLSSD